jgi:peroxiredoxin family protein
MNKFIITEEEKSRILGMHTFRTKNHYLMEQSSEVSDYERAQFGDLMMKEYIEEVFPEEIDSYKERKKEINHMVYDSIYRQNMAGIDEDLKKKGFPNGFTIPENISRVDFDKLKNDWKNSLK